MADDMPFAIGEGPFEVTIDKVIVSPVDNPQVDSDEPVFTPEQDRRASALYHARSLLEDKGHPLTKDGSRYTRPVTDMLALAHYIIEGPVSDGNEG